MARVALPESRLKSRKRKYRLRLLTVFCVFVGILCGLIVGLAHIPVLQVQHITVSGTQTLSSSTIRTFVESRIEGEYALVIPKRNIFLYPKQQINEALLALYPVLASADVHAGDFQTITVNVVERSPRALWCSETGGCLFMDENGIIYADAPTFSAPVYVMYYGVASGDTLPKQYLTAAQFQSLSALVDAIGLKLPNEQITAVQVDAQNDVHVQFVSGFELKFALADASGDIFERFTLALTNPPFSDHPLSAIAYLDLRFGDKLYYKLK